MQMDWKQVETLKMFYPFSLPRASHLVLWAFRAFGPIHVEDIAHLPNTWDQSTEVKFTLVPFRATCHFGTPNPHKSHGLSSCSFILRVQTYSDTYSDTYPNIFELSLGGTVSVMLRRTQWPICGIPCTHDRGADPRGTRTSPRRIRRCANPERCHQRKEALISSN